MSNMGYCRFENTYNDLRDCYEALQNEDELSESEQKYRVKIMRLCEQMLADFDEEY